MKIVDELFVVMTKDKKKIMKGLSKSCRYLMDINNNSQYLSTFTTKKSAASWLNGNRIIGMGEYETKDLEVTKIAVEYYINE